MRPIWGAVVIALLLAADAGASAAELIVVSDSAAIGYPRGLVLQDGAAIKIAAGARLALIDSSGRGTTISGPFDGVAHVAPGASPANASVIAAMQKIIAASDDRREAAVVREAGTAPRPSNPHAIDAGDDATQCAAPAGPVELWRPPPQRRSTLFVTRLSTSERATLDWPSNRAIMPWPAAIKLVDGETYQLALQGELAKTRLVVRLVDFAEPALDAATRLADAGCGRQALNMLESIADPSR